MKIEDIPILVTTAVEAVAPFVSVTDRNLRIALSLEAIKQWLMLYPTARIVVCDGSNFDFRPSLRAFGSDKSDRVESIFFDSDREQVMQKGKGFGEGEIVAYALWHSRWIRECSVFAKCTGKLWISNFKPCLFGFNKKISIDCSYENVLRFTDRRIQCDTRFYLVNKTFYLKHFAQAHDAVNDYAGYYLENAFAASLSGIIHNRTDFLIAPQIHGVSGSLGTRYEPVEAPMFDSLGAGALRALSRITKRIE